MGTAVELINGWILPVLAGPVIGSFIGVLVRRLPSGRDVIYARSACESCGRVLSPAELIPILSYFRQRGRCAGCAGPIPAEHLQIELAALAVAALSAFLVLPGPMLWLTCALGWWLLALAWIDARSFRLPDLLTLPLLAAGLAEAFWLEPEARLSRTLAAALAYSTLWLLAFFYHHLRGREGLGLGDAKLLAAGGAWVGVSGLPFVMFLGAILALLYALSMWLRGMPLTRTTRLPFGPFLAASIWLAWLVRP
jgi:leader peptidase (prepilin peptidase)/N-methyltransferase